MTTKFVKITPCTETARGFEPIKEATIINKDCVVSIDASEKSVEHCIIRTIDKQKIFIEATFQECIFIFEAGDASGRND